MFLNSKTVFFTRVLPAFCFALLLTACTIVRNPPKNQPFVFRNKVTLKGNVTKDEKIRLSEELNNYWDDSMKANRVQQLGFIYKLRNPPVFDTNNLARSKSYMNAYLNSQGYYYASFIPSHHFDTIKAQIRANVAYTISLGKSIMIDTVAYNMLDTTKQPIDSTLQKITMLQAKYGLIKKGNPYTKQIINSELDRLLNLYHQNGYYKFTREDMYALVDTLDSRFLKLVLDPLEQAQLIAAADKKRRENPTWGITIMQRMGRDSSATQQFHIGNIYYYPDLKDAYYNPDTIINNKSYKSATQKEMTIFYRDERIHFRPLREHTFLRNGDLYNEDLYYKSVSRLSQIGTWKQVDIKPSIRGKDSIDLYVFMIPEKKQGYTINQEFSKNTGDIGSGNLLGLATNLSYKNRNVGRQAIQSLTSLRFGVELNIDKKTATAAKQPLLQTTQVNLSQTYIFPRWVLPKTILNTLDNKRSLFNVAGSYTDRKTLYQLRSFVTSIGFEGIKGNNTYLFKLPNIELYKVDTLPGLDTLFKSNPFLRNSFKDGQVVGISFLWNKTFTSKRNPSKNHYIRFGYEESGWGINQIIGPTSHVFEYNKLEGEYRYIKNYRKTELATRFFTGVGLHSSPSMPVFKQYFMGGPNSMRAWGLRQLGLGSSQASDTTTGGYTDRFGDFTMEANVEYRFPLGTLAGIKIGSALYSDMGNVWNINKQAADPNASFDIKRLDKDLAIGVGTGIRVDFSYFLIRVDFAYKLKDPARLGNNGWMDFDHFEWTSVRQNGVRIKNYAFQLGIGLPF
ncbi:BamA/TamA family outer membrane protein [Parasediminibacterium sp. JCM 36343]|uniref:BamA/TamA family outer membrane protein n=1 Tax=Parasediminibacterium sp. JCM 36343 TaxID=3374279 RepID=UPI0039796956